MVAMLGWIIPDPLHIPPTLTPRPPISISFAAVFGTVSVVMIARAASTPWSGLNEAHAAVIPALTASIGRERPITPGGATSTWSGARARRAGGSVGPTGGAL